MLRAIVVKNNFRRKESRHQNRLYEKLRRCAEGIRQKLPG